MSEKFTARRIPKVMFVNCGHGTTRRLEDCARLSFVSAGQGKEDNVRPFYFVNQIRNLIKGDIIAVYRTGIGYVGIARVLSGPMTITRSYLHGQRVENTMFSSAADMFKNANDPGHAECLVEIQWLTNVYTGDSERSGACFGIFAKQLAVCSLDNQFFLKQELQNAFGLAFEELLRRGSGDN